MYGVSGKVTAGAVLLGAGVVAGVLIVSSGGKSSPAQIVVRQDAATSAVAVAPSNLPVKREVVDVPSKLSVPSAVSVAVKKPAAVVQSLEESVSQAPTVAPSIPDPTPVESVTPQPVVSSDPPVTQLPSSDPVADPTPTETFIPPNPQTNPNIPPTPRSFSNPVVPCINAATGKPC